MLEKARTLALVALLFGPAPAFGAPALGDLNGDGVVSSLDQAVLAGYLGTTTSSLGYDPAADLDDDGVIGSSDEAILDSQLGQTGDVDTTPPSLFVSVNDIPDDMNDVIVVPPGGFQVTAQYDGGTGSVMDPGSLSVVAGFDLPGAPAASPLAALFQAGGTRAVLDVPDDANLPPESHNILVFVSDLAGNQSFAIYAFASREFQIGAPMENTQQIFLDFGQDRSLGAEIDFIEDLREYGLSAAAFPMMEEAMRQLVTAEIVKRTQAYYGYKASGQPGPDPVDIEFQSTAPAGTHSRLCIGGESALGGQNLGAAPLDINNVNKQNDECAVSSLFGVFPQAIDNLWLSDANYVAAFGPVDPGLGGVPVGEHELDAILFDPDFSLATAQPEELQRLFDVLFAVDAFAATVATAAAHETGHMLGLSAPGPAPMGLYGGSWSWYQDHNVTVAGTTPAENYVMNAGNTFTFPEVSGQGAPLPKFRPLSWAYLHDRVALNSVVTALHPAPILDSVDSPVGFAGSFTAEVSLHGGSFIGPLQVKLWGNSPIPFLVSSSSVNAFGTTVTAEINALFVPPGSYDVEVINVDGQSMTAYDALVVIP